MLQGKVETTSPIWDKRPEQLGVDAFVELTNSIQLQLQSLTNSKFPDNTSSTFRVD
jgi:hypothetical protein